VSACEGTEVDAAPPVPKGVLVDVDKDDFVGIVEEPFGNCIRHVLAGDSLHRFATLFNVLEIEEVITTIPAASSSSTSCQR